MTYLESYPVLLLVLLHTNRDSKELLTNNYFSFSRSRYVSSNDVLMWSSSTRDRDLVKCGPGNGCTVNKTLTPLVKSMGETPRINYTLRHVVPKKRENNHQHQWDRSISRSSEIIGLECPSQAVGCCDFLVIITRPNIFHFFLT